MGTQACSPILISHTLSTPSTHILVPFLVSPFLPTNRKIILNSCTEYTFASPFIYFLVLVAPLVRCCTQSLWTTLPSLPSSSVDTDLCNPSSIHRTNKHASPIESRYSCVRLYRQSFLGVNQLSTIASTAIQSFTINYNSNSKYISVLLGVTH